MQFLAAFCRIFEICFDFNKQKRYNKEPAGQGGVELHRRAAGLPCRSKSV